MCVHTFAVAEADQQIYTKPFYYTLSGKAVTGAVPFQKVHFCTQRLHIGTLVVHIST